MKEFIEFIIKYLVDNPDEVRINEINGDQTVIFELHVGDGDIGKVIGRGGKTAQSLRTLLSATAAKQGKRSVLEILENETEKTE
ncbi:MAG: KH domain-containing protein [bacterium]